MDGVVKLVVPEAKGDPPVAAAYQSTVFPAPTVAVNVIVPAEDLEPFVPTGAEGIAFPFNDTVRVVAPVEVINSIPEGFPVAEATIRINTEVPFTEPPDLGRDKVEE